MIAPTIIHTFLLLTASISRLSFSKIGPTLVWRFFLRFPVDEYGALAGFSRRVRQHPKKKTSRCRLTGLSSRNRWMNSASIKIKITVTPTVRLCH